MAAGYKARALHNGSFVWNDRSITAGDDSLLSTGQNQFLIRAAGGVGIGTNSPTKQLSVVGGAQFDSVQIGTVSSDVKLDIAGGAWDLTAGDGDVRIGSANQKLKIGVSTGGGGAGIVRLNASGDVPRIFLGLSDVDIVSVAPNGFNPHADTTYSLGKSDRRWTDIYAKNAVIQTSDLRMKKDVRMIGYGLREIMTLKPASFKWESGNDRSTHLGLIAQEVANIVPEAVVAPDSEDGYLGMRYSELIPVLIKAIQEQQEIIEAQGLRLAALESGGSY